MRLALMVQKPNTRAVRPALQPGRVLVSAMVAVVIGVCASLPASALQPLVTDDTGIQGKDRNQLELGFDRDRTRSQGERTTERIATLVYTRGLADTLDGYIELSRTRIRSSMPDTDASGSANPVLGFKWRLWENEAQALSIGVRPEIQFGVSTASERQGLGAARTGYAATLIVSKQTQFGEVHANLSAMRTDYALAENREANRRTLYRLSVAPVVTVSSEWRIALDAGVLTNPDRAQRARMGYVQLATIWSPRDDLELAVGFTRQFGDGEPSRGTLSAGLTWRF